MLNENILLYGHQELPPVPLELRAGPLTMIFEPDNAFLRYLRLGDDEIVRNIYAVVRDHNWNTIPWQVKNLVTSIQAESFELNFDVECQEGPVEYFWRGSLSGSAEGQVTFSFHGEAKSSFLRNRIGICVLHPIRECAGKSCAIEHTDGKSEQTSFPKHIAPWQPLRDVRAITYEVGKTINAEIRFDGDVFETEDQRNFGDASFKTYSTPQDLPKPVQVKAGDRVQHKIIITLQNSGHAPIPRATQVPVASISIDRNAVSARPALGLQLSSDGHRMSDVEAERIRALSLTHLRTDITLASAGWQAQFQTASEEAKRLRLPLYVGLHCSQSIETELAGLVRVITDLRPGVAMWIIYKRGESFPSNETMQGARRILAAGPDLLCGAATPFFTELNRHRPPSGFDALACYPITPQIHLTDRNTLMENVADVTEMIATAATFLDQPVVVSPITLRRSEPKPSLSQAGRDETLPVTVDPRQVSLFAAAWTLAHISRLATGKHLHSATYFETTGWRGLMERAGGSPLPASFLSIPGAVFPAYHVFADIAGCTRVCATESTLPLRIAALTVLDANNRPRVLVANLTCQSQEITVAINGIQVRMRRLNAGNAESAMRSPETFRQQPGQLVNCAEGKLATTLAHYEILRLDPV